ncbi:hypothetical protein [Halarchaeum nitratireducens]|uniref:Uncharacterized protein n=1 Tax=Halarchaeum nitratireducens TaxID=489913 RepID=A0A830G8J7_9EURY|nr:hypothetical protein [Halarchaeum nitratireducens]GGN08073.1 hypothetical protein GCM10009021_04250 [Halarchaeum nitratireducens]
MYDDDSRGLNAPAHDASIARRDSGPDAIDECYCAVCDTACVTPEELFEEHADCRDAEDGGRRVIADGGEHEPERATLRDGETRDRDVHARRNAEQLAMRDDSEDSMEADVVKLTQAQVDDLADDGVAWLTTDDRILVLGREDRYPEVLESVADGADEDEVVLERIRDASGTEADS